MSKMNNKLIRVQQIVFDELERLDDKDYMNSGMGKRELDRSKAVSNSAHTFINTVNLSLKIKDIAKKSKQNEKELLKELDIINE